MKQHALIIIFAVLFLGVIGFINGCTKVDTGEVGFVTRFGKIVDEKVSHEGLMLYNPITSKGVIYDTKNQIVTMKMEQYTKDIQQATVEISVTFSLDGEKAMEIHSHTGRKYVEKLVLPAILTATKNVLGTYEAQEAIPKRDEVRQKINDCLKNELGKYGILITLVNLADISYTDVFEKAVEEKQVAMQNAIRAKNETARIDEEGKQKVITAEAEAKAIEVRAKALEKNKSLIAYEAIQKWNGVLPQYFLGGGGVLPTFELGNIAK